VTGRNVAVVILNWKGWEDTIACIESMLRTQYEALSLFVCDNASPNDSVARLRGWVSEKLPGLNAERVAAGKVAMTVRDLADTPSLGPDGAVSGGGTGVITLIQTGANLGYAGGNNVGMRYALAEAFDYFWVINNDTEVEPDAIGAIVDRMEKDPSIGLCGSTLIYSGQRDLVQNLGGGGFSRFKGRGLPLGFQQAVTKPVDQDSVEAQLEYISGAAAMASRPFLEQVGLMQDDYFLYWEELDWSMRAAGRFKLGYAAESVVYHKVGASIGTSDFGDSTAFSDYYMVRNRVRVCWRFSKVSLPFIYGDTARDVLRWCRRGNWSRAWLIMRAALGMSYVSAAR